MKTGLSLLCTLICCLTAMTDEALDKLSKHLGDTSALVVVVCDGSEQDLSALAGMVENTPWTMFCRGGVSPGMSKLRDWARGNGVLGKRVYVASDDGPSLWLAGDLADAVWIAPGSDQPPTKEEILRVLRPDGVCIGSGGVFVKPIPPGSDEWRHPYHDPDNNIVSTDETARLPGELRFQTFPVFAAMPNQSLLAGGRLFFFSGHIAFHEREEPLLNTLTVLNAYNGLPLWSRDLDPNFVVHNVAKFATANELVFAEGGTLWILAAATGEPISKIPVPTAAAAAGDTDWKWIAQDKGLLWAAFGPPDATVAPHRQKRQMGHWPWDVANEQYQSITNKFGAARRLAAFQYPEMKLLWSIEETEPFDARSLCMHSGRIFELAPRQYMAARDAATGKTLWRKTPDTSQELFATIGDAIKRQGWGLGWATYCWRASQDVVCIAGPPFRKTIGVSFTSGDHLWTLDGESPHPFFFDDELYVMPRVAAPSAACRKLNPSTGAVIDEFGLGVIGSCTRLTVTPHQFFYRPGGGVGSTVYFDMESQKLADYVGIVRPGCFDGVIPANGRLYWMPLACDCWQVHGTFCMAPRSTLKEPGALADAIPWGAPLSSAAADPDDWPMFRANASGTATVTAPVPKKVREVWRRRLPGGGLTAPVSAQGRVFVGGGDGTVRALDAAKGEVLWTTPSSGAVVYPPVYWNGRVVFGSCDGGLYCLDAANGKRLGRTELAPEKRFVNIMGRFMSAWPLGGGVVVNDEGIAYAAAGSTAADGAVTAALDLTTGQYRWRQAYTLDRQDPKLSFGVQGNLLLNDDSLYINGGAPVGIVALDTGTGGNPRIVASLEAGMDLFLDADRKPLGSGPELYANEPARTTIFKRHQGRVYFQAAKHHIALVDGRLFCARDRQSLDRIVETMNKDPRTGGKMGGATVPWDVMKIPVDDSLLWAGDAADVIGLAVGSDGLVALHRNRVEGIALDGKTLWTASMPSMPVRWGIALTGSECVVTLADGMVVCLAEGS